MTMKRAAATILFGLTMVLGAAAPAVADHDYGGYGRGYDDRDGRECRGGGCGNEREESYDQTGCKYFCPAFDDSPVQDSFNVCLPGATCNWNGRQPEERQPDEGQQPPA